MGFDYIINVPLLPSCCGFFFMFLDVEYLFRQGLVFFIDGCSAFSCVCGVLMRGGESKVLLLCHLGFDFSSIGFLYTCNYQSENEIKKTFQFIIASR